RVRPRPLVRQMGGVVDLLSAALISARLATGESGHLLGGDARDVLQGDAPKQERAERARRNRRQRSCEQGQRWSLFEWPCSSAQRRGERMHRLDWLVDVPAARSGRRPGLLPLPEG